MTSTLGIPSPRPALITLLHPVLLARPPAPTPASLPGPAAQAAPRPGECDSGGSSQWSTITTRGSPPTGERGMVRSTARRTTPVPEVREGHGHRTWPSGPAESRDIPRRRSPLPLPPSCSSPRRVCEQAIPPLVGHRPELIARHPEAPAARSRVASTIRVHVAFPKMPSLRSTGVGKQLPSEAE